MSVSAISSFNYASSHPYKKGVTSPVNFTSAQNPDQNISQNKRNTGKKILIGTLLLGAAGVATALIFKKINAGSEVGKLKKTVTNIFNETWEDVLKKSGAEDLKLKKPSLKISYDKEENELGHYAICDNSITINMHHLNTYEYVVRKDKKFMAKGTTLPFHTMEQVEQLKKDGKIDSSWTVQKLTQAEKLFYLRHVIAHEQRHCLQFHSILNDADYGPRFLLEASAKKLKEKYPEKSPDELMKIAKQIYPYFTKFKNSGTKRGINLTLPGENGPRKVIYGSKDFAQNYTEYNSKFDGKVLPSEYDLNLLEIDANNFASKYLDLNKQNQEGCSEDIVKIVTKFNSIQDNERIRQFVKNSRKNAA